MPLINTVKTKLKALLISYFPNSEFARLMFYLPVIRKFDFSKSIYFNSRTEIYDYINSELLHGLPISYLEFGVYEGESFYYWSKLNTNQNSEFIGFDTFTGLPENWMKIGSTMRKNHFDVKGKAPVITDRRCKFIKGLFQDTLPEFVETFVPKERLVIHNDSDLYTSTLFTLVTLHKFLKKGTIIIFDEFCSPLHELRAFDDYTSSHLVNYRIICHTKNYIQVAVMIY
ncbi:MAG: class I SAM-dependent methyltransferase [Chitinophagaceae bacterium]|nr:class I SAM-dependent methyltransferase [Chitinophagaceae bacterium]